MPARDRHHPASTVVVLVGATASGKSELALELAERLDGEIVSADSRQVYRGMDVGTAKPTPSERERVPHHLLDVVDPDQSFTAAEWVELARLALSEIRSRGRVPLIVGGTGLYVTALLDGYDFRSGPPAPELRARMTADLAEHGLESLAARLAERDPVLAARTDLRNPHRVIRALERLDADGSAAGSTERKPYRADVTVIGLERPREVLWDRIAERTRAMFGAGLVDEARRLRDCGYDPALPAMSGIGYGEALGQLAGELSLEEAIERTVQRTRQLARRQLTWVRRDPRLRWLSAGATPGTAPALVDRALAMIEDGA